MKAAISNRERKLIRLKVTKNALARLELDASEVLACPIEIVSPQDIDKLLGPDAIHQGVLLETKPLPVRKLDSLKDKPLLLVLDQVTKWWLLQTMQQNDGRFIEVTGFFDIVLVWNRGVSFGMFNNDAGLNGMLFSLLSSAAKTKADIRGWDSLPS